MRSAASGILRALPSGAMGRQAGIGPQGAVMRRMVVVAALAAGGLAAASEPAAAAGLDLRAGAFFPRADSNIFDDTEELFGAQKDDWIGFTGGVEYSFGVAEHV